MEAAAGSKGLDYASRLTLATAVWGHQIASRSADPDRKQRMEGVVNQRLQAAALPHAAAALEALAAGYEQAEDSDRVGLLVDLRFADPFAPYVVTHSREDRKAALHDVGEAIGAGRGVVERVLREADIARATHHFVNDDASLWKIGAAFTATTAAVALTHGAILPFVGHAHGVAGAAALTHGLNVISFGHGIAGGLWVLTSGAAFATAQRRKLLGPLLQEIGSKGVETELMKLQTSVSTLGISNEPLATARQLLTAWQDEISGDLDLERDLNDPGAARVRERERVLSAIERTSAWFDQGSGGRATTAQRVQAATDKGQDYVGEAQYRLREWARRKRAENAVVAPESVRAAEEQWRAMGMLREDQHLVVKSAKGGLLSTSVEYDVVDGPSPRNVGD